MIGKKYCKMTMEDKAIQKAERLTLIGFLLAIVVGGIYLLSPPASADQMFTNETDVNLMFAYPPQYFDSGVQNMTVEGRILNESGYSVYYFEDVKINMTKPVSVIATLEGWDILFEIQIIQTVMLFIIMVCAVVLTIFRVLRLK